MFSKLFVQNLAELRVFLFYKPKYIGCGQYRCNTCYSSAEAQKNLGQILISGPLGPWSLISPSGFFCFPLHNLTTDPRYISSIFRYIFISKLGVLCLWSQSCRGFRATIIHPSPPPHWPGKPLATAQKSLWLGFGSPENNLCLSTLKNLCSPSAWTPRTRVQSWNQLHRAHGFQHRKSQLWGVYCARCNDSVILRSYDSMICASEESGIARCPFKLGILQNFPKIGCANLTTSLSSSIWAPACFTHPKRTTFWHSKTDDEV